MLFLRHPKPEVAPGICYGQTDLDIGQEGRDQIARALELTPPVARIVASPARRCRELAMALARRHDLELQFDGRLWEMHMGNWEGLPWSQIPRAHSEPWLKDPFNLPTPGGECFRDVQRRVLAAIGELGASEDTLLVCHAGPIRAVQMAWHGLSFREAFASTPAYAEPIELRPPVAALR
jgi:alpha-ribazole phosphatase